MHFNFLKQQYSIIVLKFTFYFNFFMTEKIKTITFLPGMSILFTFEVGLSCDCFASMRKKKQKKNICSWHIFISRIKHLITSHSETISYELPPPHTLQYIFFNSVSICHCGGSLEMTSACIRKILSVDFKLYFLITVPHDSVYTLSPNTYNKS